MIEESTPVVRSLVVVEGFNDTNGGSTFLSRAFGLQQLDFLFGSQIHKVQRLLFEFLVKLTTTTYHY